MCNFYKTNSEILKLDPFKERDLLYIMFNHWIERKENLNRINGRKGTLEIAINVVEKEFEISRNKTQRMIKWFEEKGIIKCLKKSTVKGKPSVYAYASVYYDEENSKKSNTNRNTNDSTNNNTEKYSNCKSLSDTNNTNDNTNDNTNGSKYKKDDINREYKKNIYSCTSDEVQLANYLYKLIQRNNPKAKEPNLQVWAKHIDLMIRIDNRTVQDIKTVIDYCQNDSFWHSNILSTKKLRDKFDMLYLKAIEKEKAPTGIGVNKNNYNSSICNSDSKYTMGVKML